MKRAARIGFVGAGKVAQTLAAAFTQAGWTVVAASSRSAANLTSLVERSPNTRASRVAQDVVDASTLVFLTVPDDDIARVCESLIWRHGVAAVHCSGATELAALGSAANGGAAVGGFHPLQMFTNPEVALQSLAGCTIGIEAPSPLRELLESMARDVGCKTFVLPPGTRALYHASASYVGPFFIALLREATQLWEQFGADERQALDALVPLLQGTVAAVMDGGLARGMGGCIARGDIGTVRLHLAALDATNPQCGLLYRELALRNVPLALARGSLSPERAQAIRSLLIAPVEL